MRPTRIKVDHAAFYHCMSRIVGGDHLLGEREKEVLRGMIWQAAEFCGVRVITYAVMSNHFHVLVFVPEQEALDDSELVRRYRVLYEKSRAPWQPTPEVLEGILTKGGALAENWRRRLLGRMHDVSEFLKTIKQRFAIWYNKSHGRYGTLWADRFKSVLLEGDARTLSTVAAYIDLNPIRAGLVEDPGDYRWCGYAEAMGGGERARAGLEEVFRGGRSGWAEVVVGYRLLLFGASAGSSANRGSIDRNRVAQVLENGGEVSVSAALRCRVRYFTDGAVIGSRGFVQRWFEENPAHASPRRAMGARSMKGTCWDGLTVYRGLRQKLYS